MTTEQKDAALAAAVDLALDLLLTNPWYTVRGIARRQLCDFQWNELRALAHKVAGPFGLSMWTVQDLIIAAAKRRAGC